MLNNQFFQIIPNINIETEKVQSFYIGDKIYTKNSFKSMKDFYDFIIENIISITRIKYEVDNQEFNSSIYYEMYLFENKRHRLDGPAVIKTSCQFEFTLEIVDNEEFFLYEKYFINDIELDENEYNRQLRIPKLKTILNKNV